MLAYYQEFKITHTLDTVLDAFHRKTKMYPCMDGWWWAAACVLQGCDSPGVVCVLLLCDYREAGDIVTYEQDFSCMTNPVPQHVDAYHAQMPEQCYGPVRRRISVRAHSVITPIATESFPAHRSIPRLSESCWRNS